MQKQTRDTNRWMAGWRTVEERNGKVLNAAAAGRADVRSVPKHS